MVDLGIDFLPELESLIQIKRVLVLLLNPLLEELPELLINLYGLIKNLMLRIMILTYHH